ncbi:hypothetical protein SH580_04530 [Coraliomargarita algicola]|uniref:Uncharacterized protein n=1 Tax=Coraliomargarita algicola TaxID=3092156 RepID=A0ABZ0RPA7_9BACT|nr:hypothetical protein [Coraliomargarita sp. J2-16]WPJ96973.1 hypothetical protein SH580_04530 [Coraliomargarita sp. J2-16]
MTTRRTRDFIKTQLLETERLIELTGEHPVMALGLSQRKEELNEMLQQLPVGNKEPRTVLFFSGEPVVGSTGIDASFAGRILAPFQNMVMSEHAQRWHGALGSRGRRTGEEESRLILTGLPRGSFGLELSKANNEELFEEDQLADTLAHVTRLVESAGRSDEDFAAELDDTAPRVIQSLREFLKVVSEGHAGLRMESGDYRCTLNPVEASDAYDRVNSTQTSETVIQERGVFKGLLLESWRFDFVNDAGHKISGKLDDNLSKEQAVELLKNYTEEHCIADLVKTTVLFKNGKVRTSYTLNGLRTAND